MRGKNPSKKKKHHAPRHHHHFRTNAETDRPSRNSETSQSQHVTQKASSQYLDAKRLEKEANNRRQQMTHAAANMDKPVGKFGKWNGSQTIRRVRDQRAGVKR